jgi:xanthine dehydrogenase accessory factor
MKLNTDTTLEDAPLVVALGPGYTAGMDCHVVVETLRGPRIGRVITTGTASPDTGVPGEVEGQSTKRVVRAPVDGLVTWNHRIGDMVEVGDVLGHVGAQPVVSDLTGMVRGLVADGTSVRFGTKVGDVDPRGSRATIEEVSDKALAVGGGVLEAVLSWLDHGQ